MPTLDGNVGLTEPEICQRLGVLLVSLSNTFHPLPWLLANLKELGQTGSAAAPGRPPDQYFPSTSSHLSSHDGCSTTQKPYYGFYAVKQITCAKVKVSARCKEKGLWVGRSRGQ
jgi:hypothetical protein